MQQGNHSSRNNTQNCMNRLSFFSFFSSCLTTRRSLLYVCSIFVAVVGTTREREREKEPRYSTQCLDNYIYMCVFRFSGTSNVLSFLFSLIQAFIDLHTVHFSSPTNTGLSVFMFKLDCIEAKESMKQKDVNSFLAQENHLLT
jgi:hypothetical protein